MAKDIIITTTDNLDTNKIERYIDIVSGTDIYLVGGVFGGGLANQEKLYGGAFSQAKQKMISKAEELNADAIVGVQTSVVSPGGLNNIIVIVQGTAVKLKQDVTKVYDINIDKNEYRTEELKEKIDDNNDDNNEEDMSVKAILQDGKKICTACGEVQNSDRKICWGCGKTFEP